MSNLGVARQRSSSAAGDIAQDQIEAPLASWQPSRICLHRPNLAIGQIALQSPLHCPQALRADVGRQQFCCAMTTRKHRCLAAWRRTRIPDSLGRRMTYRSEFCNEPRAVVDQICVHSFNGLISREQFATCGFALIVFADRECGLPPVEAFPAPDDPPWMSETFCDGIDGFNDRFAR